MYTSSVENHNNFALLSCEKRQLSGYAKMLRDYFGGNLWPSAFFSDPVRVLSIGRNPIQVLLIRSDPVRVLSIRSDPIRSRFC